MEDMNKEIQEKIEDNIEKFNLGKEIREWIVSIAIAMAIALVIRYFVFTPTMVKQTSMYPTLKDGERLFLSRMIRNFKKLPERGDIITFEAPDIKAKDNENPVAYYNNHTLFEKFVRNFLELSGKRSYIKRVIALPGEEIQIKDGKVYINGKELEEDYLEEGLKTEMIADGQFDKLIVPDNCIYVMGDNRIGSQDSRSFGCIPVNKIEGKVKFRIWPLNVFGKIE